MLMKTSLRLMLLSVAMAIGACAKGDGLVVVTLDADPPLADVVTVHATATVGVHTSSFDVAADPRSGGAVSIPPQITFGVQVPTKYGSRLSLHLEARDANGQALGTGDGQTSVHSGGRTDVRVVIGGGSSVDMAGDNGDMAGTNGDMPSQTVPPAILLSPMSTSRVSSKQPTLRWTLPAGVSNPQVDICTTRDCATNAVTVTVAPTGDSAKPNSTLSPGTYFWRVRVSMGGNSATSNTWQFTVGARSGGTIDSSAGTILDINGDGLADVAVGSDCAPWDNTIGTCGSGLAYVYLGNTNGLVTSTFKKLGGSDPEGSNFGWSIASAGDVNGDGFGDLIVGMPGDGNTNPGKAYVYLGGPSGITAAPIALTDPRNAAADQFGYSVAGVGDINGDGYGDVIVGAEKSAVGNIPYVYVFWGSASGSKQMGNVEITGPDGATSLFGQSVATAGDVNGDGYADFVVAAKDNAYVFVNTMGKVSTTPIKLTGVGTSVAGGGDLDGDGYSDVAAGPSSTGTGATVFYGGASGPSSTGRKTALTAQGNQYGNAMAMGSDLNADGYGDLVVGAFSTNPAGQISYYLGGSSGVTDSPNNIVSPDTSAGDIFGGSVAMAGDVDGNGYDDMLVGARNVPVAPNTATSYKTGKVAVIYGSSSGFNMGRALLFFAGPEAFTVSFGKSVAALFRRSLRHRFGG